MGIEVDRVLGAGIELYRSVAGSLPRGAADMLTVVLLAIFIVAVALVSWQFYRTLSRRDFIQLNLHRYNLAENMVRKKAFGFLVYIAENLLVMPLLILAWFVLLAVMLFTISEAPRIETILLVSASLVAAIRALAYFVPQLSEDVAKLFPLIMLSVFLISPAQISVEHFLLQAGDVPLLFDNILYFFLAVYIIEIILRCWTTLVAVWNEED